MTADAPRILIRTDGDRHVGMGHVARMMTLADRLVARGADVTFATRPGTTVDRIRPTGHSVLVLPDSLDSGSARPWPSELQHADVEATLELADNRFAVVVVDHYSLDHEWESRARSMADRVVVVDDLADRDRDCDVVVDHNWYGEGTADRYRGRVPAAATLLLGPRYAMLQPAYAELHRVPRTTPQWPPAEILVSFGGTDATGETVKVVRALDHPDFAGIDVTVAVGSRAVITDDLRTALASRPRTELLVDLPTLAPLLHRVDLAIGASGAGTWERICMRTPAIVATSRPEQSGVTEQLATAGMTTWVGLAQDTTIEIYREALSNDAPPPVPPPLVDGHGAERVATALMPERSDPTLRPATTDDVAMFLGVDPAGPDGWGRMLDGPSTWRRLEDWFHGNVVSGNLFIVADGALPVGRAVRDPDTGDLDIALDAFAAHLSDDFARTVRRTNDLDPRDERP